MSTYREIIGKKIKKVSSDPSTGNDGEMWYNSTTGTLRSLAVSKAWRSAPVFTTNRYGASGSGSLAAGLITGGNAVTPSADVPSNATEEWDGNGWSTGGNLSTARYYGGSFGTQTASLFTGGDSRPPGSGSQTTTELYNGTSWTSGTALPTSVTLVSGLGTTPAGLIVGSPSFATATFEYDGEWSSGGVMTTGRRWMGTAGTQTAGLAFGGQIPPSGYSTNVTEAYDGSSWTNGGSLNVTRAVNAVGGGINQDASQTNTLAAGGYQSSGSPKSLFNETESYDGTSWTTQPNMATSIGYGTGGGTGSAGISAGAYTGSTPAVGTTEEFSSSTNVVTAGAWAAAASMNTTAYGRAGCGTVPAGLLFGGYGGGTSKTETETYDGTSFTEVGDMSTGRRYMAGFGTQTAAVCAGGNTPPGRVTAVEEYNGSAWGTNPNSLPTAVQSNTGTGTATAGLVFGGNTGAGGATTAAAFEFDGTSFANPSTMNTSRSGLGSAGTQTASLAYGGATGSPASIKSETESYNGTSWTNSPTPLIAARKEPGSAGTATAALCFGGNNPVPTQHTNYQLYNGTTWVTQPSMAIARSYIAGFGISTSALGASGYGPAMNPDASRTEEFTGETTAVNIKDFTTS